MESAVSNGVMTLLSVGIVSAFLLSVCYGRYIGSCSNINLVTREQWGARPPKNTTDIKTPVSEFFVHHTAGIWHECFNMTSCIKVVRRIQNFHMDDRGWDDIGYNFLVGEDGNVYEGRGWSHVGAQVKGYNSKSYGTSVMGDYMEKLPNSKALTALKGVIACGVQLGKLSSGYRLYGHRDAEDTSCPGDSLYKEIQTWPHYSHQPPKVFVLTENEVAFEIAVNLL